MDQDEEQEVRVVAPANTVVKPLAMVIKSVDADVANVAVTTSRQDNHFASRTNLSHVKFIQQLH